MNHTSIIITVIIVLLQSCNGTISHEKSNTPKQPAQLNLIRIIKPTNGEMVAKNTPVPLEIKILDESQAPDSITVIIDSESSFRMEGTLGMVSTSNLALGTKQIRATAWLKGNRQTASVAIKIKQNIPPKHFKYRIVNTFPHDINAYTQGLFYHNGYLYESTGQKGASSLRQVDIKTGKVIQSVNLENQYFGEGATLLNDEIFQVTWRSRTGFVYDLNTFARKRTFSYTPEGWGLTTCDETLVMSDGSNTLFFYEPTSFSEINRIEVYSNDGPVQELNELEYINGTIFANVYQTERVVIINPKTGAVEGEIDFSGLIKAGDKHKNIDVFNGIAWDPQGKRLFVTGKNWPNLFEVEIF